jgi:hypothetical protein
MRHIREKFFTSSSLSPRLIENQLNNLTPETLKKISPEEINRLNIFQKRPLLSHLSYSPIFPYLLISSPTISAIFWAAPLSPRILRSLARISANFSG